MGPLPPGPDRARAEPKRVDLSPKLQVGGLYRYNLDKIRVVWKLEDTFISLYPVLNYRLLIIEQPATLNRDQTGLIPGAQSVSIRVSTQ